MRYTRYMRKTRKLRETLISYLLVLQLAERMQARGLTQCSGWTDSQPSWPPPCPEALCHSPLKRATLDEPSTSMFPL